MAYCDVCGKYAKNPRKAGYAIVDDYYEEKSYLLCFRCIRRWEAEQRRRGSGDPISDLLERGNRRIGETLGSADWLLPKKRRR